jgi:hypothetical protein
MAHRKHGRSVQIGEDPWEGSSDNFKLSKGLVRRLHAHSVFTLKDATIKEWTSWVELFGN